MSEWNFEAHYGKNLGGTYTVVYYVPAPDFKMYPVKPKMIRCDYVVDSEMEAKEDCRLLNSLDTLATGVKKHSYKVGDDVSYGFNGDWYYAGKIERFTKSGKFFTTDKGYKFSLKLVKDELVLFMDEKLEVFQIEREIFKQVNSPFTAAKGIFQEKNPHF